MVFFVVDYLNPSLIILLLKNNICIKTVSCSLRTSGNFLHNNEEKEKKIMKYLGTSKIEMRAH
jgi:hypothetical protein